MITILGGGIAGLSLAYYLSNKIPGKKIIILEKEKNLGGVCRYTHISDKLFPICYHHIMLSDKHTLKLVNDLCLEKELFWVKSTMSFYKSENYYTLSSVGDILSYPNLSYKDKAVLIVFILKCLFGFFDRIDYSIKARDFIIKKTNKRVYLEIFEPLLRFKFADLKDGIMAKWVIERIKVKEANSMFGFLRSGNGSIIDELEKNLRMRGVNIINNCLVKKINLSKNKSGNFVIDAVNNNGELNLYSNKIVSTFPWGEFIKLIKNPDEVGLNQFRNIKYTKAISVIINLKKKLNIPYWTNNLDSRFKIGGFFNYPSKSSLVYLAKYVSKFNKGDDDKIVSEFMKICKLKSSDIRDKRAYLIHNADPLPDNFYDLGQLNKLKKEGMFFVGINTLPFKTNLDSAIFSAKSAVKGLI